tara:strand:+ start:22607 stop:23698 length:1092 start_codon:yes stop_codon:yes gene_type:complete
MKNKILIGPVNDRDVGAVPSLNRFIMKGLSSKYNFIPFSTNRKYGKSNLSKFNVINIIYFFKEYLNFLYLLFFKRPSIVHYPITSFWNLEKSLVFLNTAKLLFVKNVFGHLHGGSFDKFWENAHPVRRKIALRLINNLNLIIVSSEYWRKYLEKIGVKTSIKVIYNVIDPRFESRFKNIDEINREGKYLFIGSLGKRKGVYDLIDISRKNKLKINIIGEEDKKGDLKKIKGLIDKHNLEQIINLIISEKLQINEKVEFFKKSKAFLFPSYNENFPLVIIEAACAGIPIITTPVGALPEFFTHMKNIYFVEPGNINEISNAIKYIHNNPVESLKLGKLAREVFKERLSTDIIMKQLDGIYLKSL